MKFGALPICAGCNYQCVDMLKAGHPNPCWYVRWLGSVHHKPFVGEGICNCKDRPECLCGSGMFPTSDGLKCEDCGRVRLAETSDTVSLAASAKIE